MLWAVLDGVLLVVSTPTIASLVRDLRRKLKKIVKSLDDVPTIVYRRKQLLLVVLWLSTTAHQSCGCWNYYLAGLSSDLRSRLPPKPRRRNAEPAAAAAATQQRHTPHDTQHSSSHGHTFKLFGDDDDLEV